MFKRVFFFMMVNLLVILTITVIFNLLGLRPYINEFGLDYEALMAFCLIWGMGGAFISLAISRWMAKRMMGVKVIPDNSTDYNARELVNTVHRLAKKAGLQKMPEVGIYESPDINAFATGPTKNRSLVAVSSGLLNALDKHEAEGVLGHEVAHIANGDMVTMTLLQGVVNAFVMFMARALAYVVVQATRDENGRGGLGYFAQFGLTILFEIVFMLFGSMVVAWFSRYREFRADAGGARLAGRTNMISALQKLQLNSKLELDDSRQPKSFQSMKISGGKSWLALFASHPPLTLRIKRLQQGSI